MNCAHASQLQTSKVQKILQILDATKSTTERAFQKLVKEVALAKREAADIHLHLLPLSNLLERCKGVSTAMPDGPTMHALPFDGLMSLFRPVLHVISLIYSNSEFFCNTARLQSILEKFCNDVIHAVLQVVNGAKVVGSYPLCHLMHPRVVFRSQPPSGLMTLSTTQLTFGLPCRRFSQWTRTRWSIC